MRGTLCRLHAAEWCRASQTWRLSGVIAVHASSSRSYGSQTSSTHKSPSKAQQSARRSQSATSAKISSPKSKGSISPLSQARSSTQDRSAASHPKAKASKLPKSPVASSSKLKTAPTPSLSLPRTKAPQTPAATSETTFSSNADDALAPLPRPNIERRDPSKPRNPVKASPKPASPSVPEPLNWTWEICDSPDPAFILERRAIYVRPWEQSQGRSFKMAATFMVVFGVLGGSYAVLHYQREVDDRDFKKQLKEGGFFAQSFYYGVLSTEFLIPIGLVVLPVMSIMSVRNAWYGVYKLYQTRTRSAIAQSSDPTHGFLTQPSSTGSAAGSAASKSETTAIWIEDGRSMLWYPGKSQDSWREIDPKDYVLRNTRDWKFARFEAPRGYLSLEKKGTNAVWPTAYQIDVRPPSEALQRSGLPIVLSTSRLEYIFGKVQAPSPSLWSIIRGRGRRT